jgi:hypothetical protein
VPKATSTPERKKLEKDIDRLKKKLDELRLYDEKLRHYADRRIALDLDDGVKVNYGKFGDLLAEVKAVWSPAVQKSRALDKLEASSVQAPAAVQPFPARQADVSFSIGNSSGPRSSNLALPRSFTDLDRDRALREGFDYLARFFENSLDELRQRNPGLEINFHRRDADAFESTAYRDGRQVSHCGIWRGRRGKSLGDICFSSSGISESSCNESMSIAENSQLIGFRPLMGVGGVGGRRDQLLTNEGMAEHLWDLFVTPLKQRW